MELNEIRTRIDEIDTQLVDLYVRRMQAVAEVAESKRESGKAVRDHGRERAVLNRLTAQAGDDLAPYVRDLYHLIFQQSRSYQASLLDQPSPLIQSIQAACAACDGRRFPSRALIACQGTEGAYAQQACEKLFEYPDILYFDRFEGVFSAVEKGMCEYGVLPVENSTAGSVKEIYDLMLRHSSFKIVRSTRLKVDHNLVAKKGTKMSDIKEIFSHPQAISQCAKFLDAMPGVKITACENTAAAAEAVAKSERTDVAAISSYNCVELYGLERLAADIQDRSNNYTRFICISKKLEIYPGADKTSLMLVLPHRPGALYQILGRFYALGMNLIKLESRPLPDREFEFMFYFDLETSVYSDEFIRLVDDLDAICEEFQYLGSYSEVI